MHFREWLDNGKKGYKKDIEVCIYSPYPRYTATHSNRQRLQGLAYIYNSIYSIFNCIQNDITSEWLILTAIPKKQTFTTPPLAKDGIIQMNLQFKSSNFKKDYEQKYKKAYFALLSLCPFQY